jgi:hypothetical protein
MSKEGQSTFIIACVLSQVAESICGSRRRAMITWHKFTDNDMIPKDRRLLLITQRTGTADLLDMDAHDAVVGHWNKYLWGFVIANQPNETPSGAKLNVRYWAEITDMPPVKLRDLDGLLPRDPNP